MNRIYLFGKVPFDVIDSHELIRLVSSWVKEKQKKLVLNMNMHGVYLYLTNDRYAKIVRSADLIYADGWGPVVVSKFQEEKLYERDNVGDFIDILFEVLETNRERVFLLGCDYNTVSLTKAIINKRYPRIVICGYNDGFFSEKDNGEILDIMIKSKPNLVLVGMGIPDQELWIYKNWEKSPKAVYMGVGGVFHYIAGTKSRAPEWMRFSGLEWIYRFIQEPGRLWRRYTIENIYIGLLVVKNIIRNIGHRMT